MQIYCIHESVHKMIHWKWTKINFTIIFKVCERGWVGLKIYVEVSTPKGDWSFVKRWKSCISAHKGSFDFQFMLLNNFIKRMTMHDGYDDGGPPFLPRMFFQSSIFLFVRSFVLTSQNCKLSFQIIWGNEKCMKYWKNGVK